MNYKTSCLYYLADTDLGFDNSWYHAQPHPIILFNVNYTVSVAITALCQYLTFLNMSLWKNSTLISPQMGIGWVTSKANPVEVFLACFKTQTCTYTWRSLHFYIKTTARLLICVSSWSMIIWASVVSHWQQQHYSWLQNENYNKKDFIGVILVIQWYLQQPTNKDRKNIWKYSQSLLLGHPLNTNTSLLETVCFVTGERERLHFSLNSTHLIFYGNFLWPLECLY